MVVMWGADQLVETLVQGGVKYLFSLSGNQILPSCIDVVIEPAPAPSLLRSG